MKRVLCIRFSNWPIQSLQQRLRSEGGCPPSLALHTAAPGATDPKPRAASEVDADLQYLRSVFPSASGGPVIMAVSREAWMAGVRPGMPLAEARSMAQPLSIHRQPAQSRPRRDNRESGAAPDSAAAANAKVEFHAWDSIGDRRALAAAAETTRRYAPIVGMDCMPLPDSLLLDITGCGQLFGGEVTLAELVVRDLQQSGWSIRIAIADTIAAVWALTHTEPGRLDVRRTSPSSQRRRSQRDAEIATLHELPIQIVPPGQQQQELARLPIAVSRLPLKDLLILAHLGIRSIGQLLALPREDLPSRLSAAAVIRVQQLLSLAEECIVPLPESNPVFAAWTSEYPASSLDDIRQVLQYLVNNVAEQIVRRRVACSMVVCDLTCGSGTKLQLAAGVVKPTQSAELMLEVLSLRLETLPLNEPVAAVSMTLQTMPIPVSRQRDLFSPTEHIRPQDELATLIARLSNRLGPQSVGTVRTQPDPRPEHSLAVESVIPGDHGLTPALQSEDVLQRLVEPDRETLQEIEQTFARPLRLLATPQPIASGDDVRRPPDRISVLGKMRQVAECCGPERIQTAWWTELPCNRDYFRVTTDSGSQLWIFRDLLTGNWYLHGLFD